MEKISKNLFRMFRDTKVTSQDFTLKFEQLKQVFDAQEALRLDSEYHQHLHDYIERLYTETVLSPIFDTCRFNDIREAEMRNLNHLQKMKKVSGYQKEKHRMKQQNEDWG